MYRLCNSVLSVMAVVVSAAFLLPALAWAEFYVCGDATQLTQAFYRDPSLARPANCSLVPNDQVEAQTILIQSFLPPLRNPGRLDYLKVVAGLATEKTPAEKQAVDDAILAQQQAQQELANERATNVFCNQQNVDAGTNAIAQRKAALYAQIDAISTLTLGTFKAGLKGVVDELATGFTLTTNCFTGRKAGS
ncbi:MAG TPA: hypothetical protein VF077_12475 [Nitrospiraceae bacterium]